MQSSNLAAFQFATYDITWQQYTHTGELANCQEQFLVVLEG